MRNSGASKGFKITAGILGLMTLVIVLFSSFYIAAEADHDCRGEDCPVCACVRQCENALHGPGDGIATRPASVASVILMLLLPAAAPAAAASRQKTLVSEKIRLNN